MVKTPYSLVAGPESIVMNLSHLSVFPFITIVFMSLHVTFPPIFPKNNLTFFLSLPSFFLSFCLSCFLSPFILSSRSKLSRSFQQSSIRQCCSDVGGLATIFLFHPKLTQATVIALALSSPNPCAESPEWRTHYPRVINAPHMLSLREHP